MISTLPQPEKRTVSSGRARKPSAKEQPTDRQSGRQSGRQSAKRRKSKRGNFSLPDRGRRCNYTVLLSTDERLKLMAVQAHWGEDTAAAVIRQLILRAWRELPLDAKVVATSPATKGLVHDG